MRLGRWAAHVVWYLFQFCFVSQWCLDPLVIKLTGFIHCDVQTSQSRARRLRQGSLKLAWGTSKGELGQRGRAIEMALFVQAALCLHPCVPS